MKPRDSGRRQFLAFLDWVYRSKSVAWFAFVFVLTCITAYVTIGLLVTILTHLPPMVNLGILLIVLGGAWRFVIDEFLDEQANQEQAKDEGTLP